MRLITKCFLLAIKKASKIDDYMYSRHMYRQGTGREHIKGRDEVGEGGERERERACT